MADSKCGFKKIIINAALSAVPPAACTRFDKSMYAGIIAGGNDNTRLPLGRCVVSNAVNVQILDLTTGRRSRCYMPLFIERLMAIPVLSVAAYMYSLHKSSIAPMYRGYTRSWWLEHRVLRTVHYLVGEALRLVLVPLFLSRFLPPCSLLLLCRLGFLLVHECVHNPRNGSHDLSSSTTRVHLHNASYHRPKARQG